MSFPRSYTFDAELELKDLGLVASSAAAQVDSAAKVIDLGSSTANFAGVAVVDVTAIEIASNDELYTIVVQGSDTSDFSGAVANLGELSLGATEVLPGGADDSTVGRYEILFTNWQDDANYRYIRAYTEVAGTIATGINYKAFVARLNGLMPS